MAFTFALLSAAEVQHHCSLGPGTPRGRCSVFLCVSSRVPVLPGAFTHLFTAVSSTSQVQKTLPLVSGSRYPCLCRSCDWSFWFWCQHKGLGLQAWSWQPSVVTYMGLLNTNKAGCTFSRKKQQSRKKTLLGNSYTLPCGSEESVKL